MSSKRNTILGLLTAAAALTFATSSVAATENITQPCEGGGSKTLAYNWNMLSGALTYTYTLQNCVPMRGDNLQTNGTMQGSGTLKIVAERIELDVTSTDALTVSGTDSGSITCTKRFQGQITGTTFAGSVNLNNCTYTVQAQNFGLLDALSIIPFY